ncbi:hypothetical protein JTB14_021095 [Gonioctena quinquepunctata]|nr:hypothetical protein JTB14_021095 [Gonioctena quinquepunctata]
MIEKLLDYFAPPSVSDKAYHLRKSKSSNFPIHAFSLTELKSALLFHRGTAAGSDITYTILNNLASLAKRTLLKMFNKWWLENDITKELRDIIVVLILKPNRDPNLTSSYRPISLMSCITKTFERMIKARLEWFLEYISKLPSSQYGSRRGMGTTEAVSQLVTDIQCSLSKNSMLVVSS